MYNKITAVEAKKIMDDHEKVTVLDVREPDELVEGYIENFKTYSFGRSIQKSRKRVRQKYSCSCLLPKRKKK